MDNQYAVATGEDGLRFGILPVDELQWLEAEGLTIEKLPTDSNSRLLETGTAKTEEADFNVPTY
jgi:hypothetical protein